MCPLVLALSWISQKFLWDALSTSISYSESPSRPTYPELAIQDGGTEHEQSNNCKCLIRNATIIYLWVTK